MRRGSCYHKIFELHYKDGLELEEVSARIMVSNPEYVEFLPVAMAAFIGYQNTQGKPEFLIIDGVPAIEQEFHLQLDSDIVLRGKMDYIKSIGTKNYVTDIKCTGMYLSDYFFSGFELGFQSMLYSYVGNQHLPNVEGFMIDAVMMRKNAKVKYDTCFFPLLPNLDEFIDEIYRKALWVQEHLPMGEDAFEHNWTSCNNKYGKCAYHDVCKAPKRLQVKLLMLDDYCDYKSIYIEGDEE
jgi:hypothetical protein